MQRARSRIAHNYTAAANNRTAIKDINANGGTSHMDYHRHSNTNHYEYWNTATTNKDTFTDIYGFPYAFPLTNANCDGAGDPSKHGNSGGQTADTAGDGRELRGRLAIDAAGDALTPS